ncbi:hypothetical protein BST97_00085 [Nonlabens spongiae]|uniref:Polysaccharide pyruvyl transferase domain-containing protein n=1 Tax=Nonlabens spongiae TaxID=331648 RepID=A0A1W6MG24_9FLAO|nr:polysaccharide pyruvyl transferase family protein [Nonlabens spongiae]ARN76527.1 hypothetical protein BST97_00085 [Nonlabens spongiae]
MKLSYYKTNLNFGDELNVCLFQDILGIENVVHEPKIQWAEMIGIGSLFERLLMNKEQVRHRNKKLRKKSLLKRFKHTYHEFKKSPIEVFGTGFIHENHDLVVLSRKIDVIALRGKFSKEKLERIAGRTYSNLALGDPGLLCRELIDHAKIEKRFKLGIIPHYADKNIKAIKDLQIINKHSKIIDIQQEPYAFLQEIAQCDTIVSTAMHGLIAADSLDIPNLRLIVSNNLTGGDFKFHDYNSVFEHSDHHKIDLLRESLANEYLEDLPAYVNKFYKSRKNEVNSINNRLYDAFKNKSRFA